MNGAAYGEVNPTRQLVKNLIDLGSTIDYYIIDNYFRSEDYNSQLRTIIEGAGANYYHLEIEKGEFEDIWHQYIGKQYLDFKKGFQGRNLCWFGCADDTSTKEHYISTGKLVLKKILDKKPEITEFLKYDQFGNFLYFTYYNYMALFGSHMMIEIGKKKKYDQVLGDFQQGTRNVANALGLPYFQTHPRFTAEPWMNIVNWDDQYKWEKWSRNTAEKKSMYEYLVNRWSETVYGNNTQFEKERWLVSGIEEGKRQPPAIIQTSPQTYFLTITESDKEIWRQSSSHWLWIGNKDFEEKKDYDKEFIEFDENNLPRIYVSLGTTINENLGFFDGVIKAMSDLGYPTIISAGNSSKLYDYLMLDKNLNENIKIELFVNQRKTLCESDVYFCHGGAGSVYEGLYYTNPMIMCPQDGDQFVNSEQMKSYKCGVVLNQSHIEKNPQRFVLEVKKSLKKVLGQYRMFRQETIGFKDGFMSCMNASQVAEKLIQIVKEKNEFIQPYRQTTVNVNDFEDSDGVLHDDSWSSCEEQPDGEE